MVTFLSVMTLSTFAFAWTTVPCMRMEFLTTAPFSTMTPRRVLDGAFNGAAVGDERIAGLGTLAVKGRDVVRNLGGDGVLRVQKRLAVLRLEEFHADFVVRLEGVDHLGETVDLVADDLEVALIGLGLDDVLGEGEKEVLLCAMAPWMRYSRRDFLMT